MGIGNVGNRGRWKVLNFLILYSVLFITHADAFSLGTIEVKSSFNENFMAEIPVHVEGESGLQVSIGSEDDYIKLGIQRDKIVDALSLHIDPVDKDKTIIKLSSSQPINHPSFNLIIKATLDSGTILENYFLAIDFQKTLSLNVPSGDTISPQAVEKNKPDITSLNKNQTPEEGIIQKQGAGVTEESKTGDETSDSKVIIVKSGDTLYRIAKKMVADKKEPILLANNTIDQLVVALWQKNKDKFIHGNMNEIDKNTILSIENIKEIVSPITLSEAKRIILEQWREWKNRDKVYVVDIPQVMKTGGDLRVSETSHLIEDLTSGDAVRQKIMEWKKDWEAEDLERYMSQYSKGFLAGGYNLSSWKEFKRNFNRIHSGIEISIDNIHIRRERYMIIASFLQRFKSDQMKTTGMKTLSFEKNEGDWKIKDEKWSRDVSGDSHIGYPYVIHVSSFRERGVAIKEVNYLRKKGYFSYDVPFKLSDSGVWYRVFIDRFSSMSGAKELVRSIMKNGHVDYAHELELPYAIETGIFESFNDVMKEISKLGEKGYSSYPLEICNPDRCSYQVLIGAYTDPEHARPVSEELSSNGIQNKIVQP